MTAQEQADHMSVDQASPLAATFPSNTFDMGFDHWKSESQAACSPGHWPTRNTMGMPGMRLPVADYSGSSPSDSPSPPGTSSVQHEQHQKRRAQNRAAQRAYRDRKVRYLLDLEKGIREIEQRMMRLQNENTELIRELCETRALNNDLRGSRNLAQATSSASLQREQHSASRVGAPNASQPKNSISHPRSEQGDIGDDSPATEIPSAKKEELESLYEPFAAMWNLIRLDPSVVKGNVSAQNVLERLRAMVEAGDVTFDPSKLRSFSTSESADMPEFAGAQESGGH